MHTYAVFQEHKYAFCLLKQYIDLYLSDVKKNAIAVSHNYDA